MSAHTTTPAGDAARTACAERVAEIIEAYDAQGWHRTGTGTDEDSAAWLAEAARACGVAAALEPVPLHRLDPAEASVTIGGETVAGLPLFDGGLTDAAGVRGALGALGSDAPLAFAEVPVHGPAPEFEAARRGRPHRAIVAVTLGGRPGLGPRNAYAFGEPAPVPVLLVGSDHAAWLREHARRGAVARVMVTARRTAVTAWNVAARIPGREPGAPALVVMTPRSGWWHCAAERGGGLAVWLETLRALAGHGPRRPVHFVATTGHELGHLGLVTQLAADPEEVRRVALWLHLGASIGAAQAPRMRLYASAPALAAQARDALHGRVRTAVEAAPPGTRPGGEAREIHDGGGRYLSLAGGHAHFHLPGDRWPEAVDAAEVAAYAEAVAALAGRLADD